MTRRLVPAAAAWCAIALLASAVPAQELVTREGKVHRGHAFPGGQETRLNPYGSSASEMTFGIKRFRTRDVQEVRPDPTPSGFLRQLEALPAGDVRARLGLLRWAQTRKLRAEIRRAAAEVLLVDPKNAEALTVFKGETKWQALRKGHLDLDQELRLGLRRLIRLESAEERRAAATRLAVATGTELPAWLIERMARSLRFDRGVVSRVPLLVNALELPAATYERFVPDSYDPLDPRPLLIALHGGGIMRSEGTPVAGTGRDALSLFTEGAKRLNWIVVAPSALEGPWGTKTNEALIQAVLIQALSRWNVDLERIHIVGHSGGGDGVWYYAGKHADEFAAVGVASAGAPKGQASIAARAGLWMYHGDEDEIVPFEPVRKAAEKLLRAKADFVYCELPNEKHGFPPAAEQDWFQFAGPRRRKKADSAFPRWSHVASPTKAEIEGLGDPSGGWGTTLPKDPSPEALFALVRGGQLDAEPAARRLVDMGPPPEGLLEPLRALVKDRNAASPARVWSAWLLGEWRDRGAIDVLGGVLRSGTDAGLLRQAARAAERIASPDNTEDLRWALLDTMRRYKAIQGNTIPYVEYERACRLGAALARAMGRVGKSADVQADLEESLVIGILRDRRRIVHRMDHGENPSLLKAHLAENVARAYRALGVDRTVFEMLIAVVKKDPAASQAVRRGRREGLPK